MRSGRRAARLVADISHRRCYALSRSDEQNSDDRRRRYDAESEAMAS